MDPKSQAIINMTKKDSDKLMNKLSQDMVYQRSIVKQQEKLLEIIDKKKSETVIRRESAKKKLEVYIEGKEIDEKYKQLKEEYETCLKNIDSFNKATTICEESIAEVKLGMDRTE